MSKFRTNSRRCPGLRVRCRVELSIQKLRTAALHGVLTVLLASAPLGAEESVDPRSGQVTLVMTDLTVPAGAIVLEVNRTLQADPEEGGPLGRQWRLNWQCSLARLESVAVVDGGTGPAVFEQEDDGGYRAGNGEKLTFDKDGGAVRTRADDLHDQFDAQGRLVEQDHGNGNRVRLHHDGEGRLERVEGPRGSFLKFQHDSAGRVTKIEASSGNTVDYAYDRAGLREVRFNGGLMAQYDYGGEGRLARLTDPATGPVTLAYDGKGRVAARRWADGTEERYERDDATNTCRYTDPTGATTTIRASQDRRQVRITEGTGRTTVMDHDESGNLVSATDPEGRTTRFTYDAQGRTTSMGMRCGTVTRFEYFGQTDRQKSILYPDGVRHEFGYDDRGNLTSVKEDDAVILSHRYDPSGLLASTSGRGLPERTFSYYPNGLVRSETNALGHRTTFQYDKRGNLVRRTDPRGGTMVWRYDAQNRVLTETDPEGGMTRFVYDEKGRLVRVIGPAGGVSRLEYDSRGRVVAETDPDGRTVRRTYDAAGRLTAAADSKGRGYTYTYDPTGRLLQKTNPKGGNTAYTYDPVGRVVKRTGPSGGTWQYDYAAGGSPTQVRGPGSPRTSFKYDKNGRREEVADGAGRSTRLSHDGQGRITGLTVNGLAQGFAYDDAGRLVRESNNVGGSRRYSYDALSRLVRETSATGLALTYEYDDVGNPVRVRSSEGGTCMMQYDHLGRLTSLTGPGGSVTRYRYDPAGRLVEIVDPLGDAKRMAYTRAGDLASVTEPSGDTAQYVYDEAGALSAVRAPSNGVTRYAHDEMGNLASATNPLGGRTRYVYDAAGRLTSSTDAKGQTITYAYDSAGRLSGKSPPDGRSVAYAYDPAGNLVAVDDGVFPVRYGYDASGRQTRIEYPAIKRTLQYAYDAAGRLAKFVDSEGRQVRYAYDEFGRLRTMHLPEESAITWGYDVRDRVVNVTYPNGVRGAWEYGPSGLPSRIAYTGKGGQTLAEWRYTYDAAGNPTSVVDGDGNRTQYRYDKGGRLTEENGPAGAVRYSYLPGGNRATRVSDGRTVRYQYDAADRLLRCGDVSFSYDANGNLVEREGPEGTTRYAYDSENRLVRVTQPGGGQVAFGYAPTGERTWRKDAAGTTHFVTDGVNLLAELDGGLNAKATYIHALGVDRPLAMWRDGQSRFYHAKALGTVACLSDGDGNAVSVGQTDAFGVPVGGAPAAQNPFTFTGREYEPALGLYYYRARYYDPALGRFVSEDPFRGHTKDPSDLNRYVYAHNAPTRHRDPLGLFELDLSGGLYRPRPGRVYTPIWKEMAKNQIPKPKFLNLVSAEMGRQKVQFEVLTGRAHPNPRSMNLYADAKAAVSKELLYARRTHGIRGDDLYLHMKGKIARQTEALGRIPTAGSAGPLPPPSSRLPTGPLPPRPPGDGTPPAPAGGAVGPPPSRGGPAPTQTQQGPTATSRARGAAETVIAKTQPSGPGFFSVVKPSGARVAKGTAGALGVGSLLANYYAGRKEGKSHADCMKETSLILAVGVGIGAITKGSAAKLLAVIGATAAGPYLAAGAATYGAYRTGMRIAEAPEIARKKIWEELRRKARATMPGILKRVDGEIEALLALRKEALAAWRDAQAQEKAGAAAVTEARDHLKELQSTVANLRKALAKVGGAAAKSTELQEMRDKALQLTREVIDGVRRLKALAADIRSAEQARLIIQIHGECKKKSVALALLAKAAKAVKAELDALKADPASLKQKRDAIDGERDKAQTAETSFKASGPDAEAKRAQYAGRRANLLGRLRTMRYVFPRDAAARSTRGGAGDFGAFHASRVQAKRLLPITEFGPKDISPAKAEKSRKECEETLAQADKLIADVEGLLKDLKKEDVDQAVEVITAAARDALRAMAGTDKLVQKAKDYLARNRHLARTHSLTVHVQDEKAKPVQGAQVRVQAANTAGKAAELRAKILNGTISEEEKAQLKQFTAEKGVGRAATDAGGTARVTPLKGWDATITASAAGYKSASTTLKAGFARTTVTLTLTKQTTVAPPKKEIVYFLEGYHTRMDPFTAAPRGNLFRLSDPKKKLPLPVVLCVQALKEVERARDGLARKDGSVRSLPILEVIRRKAHSMALTLPYWSLPTFMNMYGSPHRVENVLRITCGKQTRYVHDVWYWGDRRGGAGNHIKTQMRWGGGLFEVGAGKSSATVAAFDAKRKIVAFNVSFAVVRGRVDPDRMADARKSLAKARERERDLAKEVEKRNLAGQHWYLKEICKCTERALFSLLSMQPPVAQLKSLFDEYVKQWERRVDLAIQLGREDNDVLSFFPRICKGMGAPRARQVLEKAIARVEANAARLKVSKLACLMARIEAAHLAIGLADDVAAARKHLQRAAELAKDKTVQEAPDFKTRKPLYYQVWPETWPTFSAGAGGR